MSHARFVRLAAAIVFSPCFWCMSHGARAENLNDAWNAAVRVNAALQARQTDSFAAGAMLEAARGARLPTMNVTALNAFLNRSPSVQFPASLAGASGARLPGSFPVLGPNQSDVPFVLANIGQPIYQGGRIRSDIRASNAGVSYQRTEERRTVLDLKLTVAETYIGVLRAQRNLDVSRSSVNQLSAFLGDVTNRKNEGLATRNEELAAAVSLANAKQQVITDREGLDVAWATYNRYVGRPPGTIVALEELAGPPSTSLDALAVRSLAVDRSMLPGTEPRSAELTGRALRSRPELQGLAARSAQSAAQADSTLSAVKPHLAFNASYVDVGSQSFTNPNLFAGTFQLSWTLFDGGQSRRRALAQRLQADSYLKQRADAAADVVLEVRTRLLDLDSSAQRVTVSGAAMASAKENIKVVTERYQQGLSVYTEVLDAETRRIQSVNSYYRAVYDNLLAMFRLRRAVGDL